METIRLNKAEFNNVLQIASQMAGVSKTLPILDNVHLDISYGKLRITSSDTEVTITKDYKLDVDETDKWDVLFNPKSLCSLLPIIDDEEIVLENKGSDILVKYANGDMSLPALDVADFPVLDLDEASVKTITIDNCEAFAETIKKASLFIANDLIRPVMNAVVVHLTTTGIEIYASDASILYFSKFAEINNEDEKIILLPAKAIKPIYSMLKSSNSSIFQIAYNDTHAQFRCDGGSVMTRLIEGKYPRVKSVIPQTSNISIVFNKKDVLDAIKHVSLSASISCVGVFETNRMFNNVEVSAKDIDFRKSSKEVIDAQLQTENELRIGFNLQKLLKSINVLDDQNIVMGANNSESATLWQGVGDTNTTVLVMPMRIE